MAEYLEKEVGILSRVRNALIYPVVVIALFGIVVGIMVGVVFPQLEPIFLESNAEIPVITKILLSGSHFIVDWWLALLIILVVFFMVVIDYLRLKLPVAGGLYKKLYVARFSESLGVLIKGGIPIAQALEISGRAIGSVPYRDALREVADAVRGGQLMSQALAEKENYFPLLVSQMVAVGESTGRIEDLLFRVSSFYTREVDDAVSSMVELIQPALMVVIGVLVALLFAAVLLPIFNLAQSF